MGSGLLDAQVLVVCQNESARLAICLQSIASALNGISARVTMVLNGSTDESEMVARSIAQSHKLPLEVWRIQAPDKSNVINQFAYSLRVPARMYALVDGYARIGPSSFSGFLTRLADTPRAVAVSGVAVNGRTMHLSTARTLGEGGVLHGQLHAFRPDFLDRMVAEGIRLPVGLYRGDGLMGSMAAHDLDALGLPWDNARIAGVAEATYEIPQLSPFRPADLQRQFRRKVRQMRGLLENNAIKDVIYRDGYTALPGSADDLIADYLAVNGVPSVSLVDRPFLALALRHLRVGQPPDPASLKPTRLA